MKRVEFTIMDGNNQPLCEPGVIESEGGLPVAMMEADNDFLDACKGAIALPMRIEITAAVDEAAYSAKWHGIQNATPMLK